MHQKGQRNSDETEDLRPFHVPFEHEIAVDDTIQRIEAQKKRSPCDGRGNPEIKDEVPEPQGLLKIDQQDYGGDHQKACGQNDPDLSQRLELYHPKTESQGGDDKRAGAQAREVEKESDGNPK